MRAQVHDLGRRPPQRQRDDDGCAASRSLHSPFLLFKKVQADPATPGTLRSRTAWSLVYLFLNGRKALSARRPGPIALAGVVAAQAATYGAYYFGQD